MSSAWCLPEYLNARKPCTSTSAWGECMAYSEESSAFAIKALSDFFLVLLRSGFKVHGVSQGILQHVILIPLRSRMNAECAAHPQNLKLWRTNIPRKFGVHGAFLSILRLYPDIPLQHE